MDDHSTISAIDFCASVAIGTFAGNVLLGVSANFSDETQALGLYDLWTLLWVSLVFGVYLFPFVAIGLTLFGLPVTRFFRRRARSWWIGPLVVLWAAVAGKLMFYAIDHLLLTRSYSLFSISPYDAGVVYSVPTGIAWWLLQRRKLNRLNQLTTFTGGSA